MKVRLHTHTQKKKNPEPCSLDWEEAFDILALFLILQKKKKIIVNSLSVKAFKNAKPKLQLELKRCSTSGKKGICLLLPPYLQFSKVINCCML